MLRRVRVLVLLGGFLQGSYNGSYEGPMRVSALPTCSPILRGFFRWHIFLVRG